MRAQLWPRALAVIQLAGFLVMERALRRDQEARTLEPVEHDRGSTVGVGAAFGFAMLAPLVTARLEGGRLPLAVGWIGAGLMAGGLGLRFAAARALGESYTRTLRVRVGQRVVDSGPYALVRHPGYAADVLMFLGYGLAWTNVATLVATTVPIATAYAYRIRVEETMLAQELGLEYRRYAKRTARLVPGLY